jgi:chorismate synthase
MASNAFGTIFRYTTWGVSHGPSVGVVIDGCPAGLPLDVKCLEVALDRRRPGVQAHTSQRKEPDQPVILSGVFDGVTTGDPVSVMVHNRDVDSTHYQASKQCYRPGHADYTYHQKYGVLDHRGGGRASARETVGRVIAGAVAQQVLDRLGVKVLTYVRGVGPIESPIVAVSESLHQWASGVNRTPHPDQAVCQQFDDYLAHLVKTGDTVGGSVGFIITDCPVGWGDPVYHKLSARLAYALMSIPAAKAFALGSGFDSHEAQGRSHNDAMRSGEAGVRFQTNHSGGMLGGISTGALIDGFLVFKPISSVTGAQDTVDHTGQNTTYSRPKQARHDPCAMIRAVPVVSAMVSCVLADAALMQRSVQLDGVK